MLTHTTRTQSSTFKIGWILLVIMAALMALLHFALIFALKEPVLFIGYTAFNLYALLILWFPFRGGEKWAWFTSWILPLGLALPASLDTNITFYYAVAALCVLGLLLTMREFLISGKPY